MPSRPRGPPVVSAIGHEQDAPLLDLVADLRASTPTDAGKRIVPDWAEESRRVRDRRSGLDRMMLTRLEQATTWLEQTRSRPAMADPAGLLPRLEAEVRTARQRSFRAVEQRIGTRSATSPTCAPGLGRSPRWPPSTGATPSWWGPTGRSCGPPTSCTPVTASACASRPALPRRRHRRSIHLMTADPLAAARRRPRGARRPQLRAGTRGPRRGRLRARVQHREPGALAGALGARNRPGRHLPGSPGRRSRADRGGAPGSGSPPDGPDRLRTDRRQDAREGLQLRPGG